MSSSISNVIKTIINTILFSLFLYQGMAQKIAIPDHKFEEALVKIGIDSEIDGFLNIDKAKAVDTLQLSTMMISDLSGIEAFTELKYLSCGQNLIKKIDLSKNTKLVSCTLNYFSSPVRFGFTQVGLVRHRSHTVQRS